MRTEGVCPRCGETVRFYVANDRTKICPCCGQIMDIDEVIENE